MASLHSVTSCDEWLTASRSGDWEAYAVSAVRCFSIPELYPLLMGSKVLPLLKKGWKVWQVLYPDEEDDLGGGWGVRTSEEDSSESSGPVAFLISIGDARKRNVLLVPSETSLLPTVSSAAKTTSVGTAVSSNPFSALCSSEDEDESEEEE